MHVQDNLNNKIGDYDLKDFRIHQIKILDKYYRAITSGIKTFEIRNNDRNYQVGDLLKFNVINDNKVTIHQPEVLYMITYILQDVPGLKLGYVIFGIKVFEV